MKSILVDMKSYKITLLSPKLEELGKALLNFQSLEDVINWL
jgi:hypothetical protein